MSTRAPVVIGFDGSEGSALALEWGMRTAQASGAEVRVIVASLAQGRVSAQARDYEHLYAETMAAAARDAVKAYEGVETNVVVEGSWPLPVLMRASTMAGLLVLGSRGHHRPDPTWIGSVTHHLALHAACPVAVIRPHRPQASQILVGVDGSPASVRALWFAARRASLTGESVLALHVYPLASYSGGVESLPDEVERDVVESASRMTAGLIGGVLAEHPEVSISGEALLGRPARLLAQLSAGSSLVVVGHRGRTEMRELLLGSVAHEVLIRAECPVVVVR